MKRLMACIGLLLCVGCVTDGILSPPLAVYTDGDLQSLVMERYSEYISAATSGDIEAARLALNAFIDVYEEMLRRPSITGHMTPAESQAMQQYLDLVREYSNAAWQAGP